MKIMTVSAPCFTGKVFIYNVWRHLDRNTSLFDDSLIASSEFSQGEICRLCLIWVDLFDFII